MATALAQMHQDASRRTHLALFGLSRKNIHLAQEPDHLTVNERVVKSGGIDVKVLEAGAKSSPLILLFHGSGDSNSESWRKIMERLAKDYHLIAMDLPGFGETRP